MTTYSEIDIRREPFLLLPQKAVFRPYCRQLILGDIHLGKATHFRRRGIAMPAQSHLKDLDTMYYLFKTWEPETVLLLGDLFHSEYNREWLWFKSLLTEHPKIRFILVEGNHDVLPEIAYVVPNLSKIKQAEEPHLIFSHHPLLNPEKFNICAHIHPGIELSGNARQSVKLPCFYKTDHQLILPAFGHLTGLHLLKRETEADYYLVTGNRVTKL